MLQKIINQLYRYPKSKVKEIKRFGGTKVYQEMLEGKKMMMVKTKQLSQVHSVLDGFEIYFLTGKNYVYQTLFCIKSLNQHCQNTFKYILVDDGTFDEELSVFVRTKISNVEIVLKKDIDYNIATFLPLSKFPVLNKKRQEYPHIKKLTDIHTLQNCKGYKLVLDSDMLFNHPPLEIKSWLENPDKAIHMADCGEAYGYSSSLMQKLCGVAISPLVNVGVFGIQSEMVNWDDLERWTKELENTEGASYYLEQALSAMLIAGKPAMVLNKEKYLVNPSEEEIDACKAILHHYVDLSKKGYYTKAWKKLI